MAQSLKSVMVNACKSPEGMNEYIIFQNGSDSIDLTAQKIDIRYGSSLPTNNTLTDSFTHRGNPNYVDSLNAKLQTCDFLFINCGPGLVQKIIPPEAYVLIYGKEPSDTPNFSTWCGQNIDTFYCVFSADPTWSSGGNFANYPSSKRYIQLLVGLDTTTYEYEANWPSNKDGNFAKLSDTSSTIYGNYSSCQPADMKSLPVTWASWEVSTSGKDIGLYWSTSSEVNADYYTVWKRAIDDDNWRIAGYRKAKGDVSVLTHYSFIDKFNGEQYLFYFIEQVDVDGESTRTKILEAISMEKPEIHIFPNPVQSMLNIRIANDEGGKIEIRDNLGRLLGTKLLGIDGQTHWNIGFLNDGIYQITIVQENKNFHEILLKSDNNLMH
jgi:hypothetical protein